MSTAGLQTYGASGNASINVSSRTTYVLGSGSTNGVAGSLTNNALNGRDWWVAPTSPASNAEGSQLYGVVFSVSGSVLSWKADTARYSNVGNLSFLYGVY